MKADWRPTAWHAGLVLAAIAGWLTLTAWMRPLSLPDEGRYVGVAWEMLRSGDWLTPTLNGLPYFHKPPLFYWITAASLATFGMNEWAARLAPLIGASAGAFALYRFATRWAGKASASAALFVLLTQPLFFIGGQFANLDMLVAGCIAVTTLALAHAALCAMQGRPDRPALFTAYLFAALGVLAKGLIGAVLPALAIAVWLLALRQYRTLFSLIWLPGVALFLCVAAPWFVAMQLRFPQFAHYFFMVQHFDRFALGGFNNPQPFWFYPAALALLTLPWSPWIIAAARRRYWSDPQQGPVRKLMWIWLAAVTAFFSLPQSKLVGYILPAAAPLAFLIADSISPRHETSPRVRRLWQLSAGLALVACLGAVLAITASPLRNSRSLGEVLAREAAAADSIVFLNEYYFDLPFYARLRSPVLVVADWGDPQLARRDNWHKELLDARQFAPPAQASVLLMPSALVDVIHASATTWVVGSRKVAVRYPVLCAAAERASSGETVLWRVAGPPSAALTTPVCPGKPSASSGDKS